MWSIYMTILIFGLSSEVHADSCPEREDIFPCYCEGFDNIDDFGKKLKVNCEFYKEKGDFETLRKGISSLSGKKDVYLRLEGYDISMPSKLFSGIDIKQLIFESCHLYSSTDDGKPWFQGLENNLEDLIIDNSLTAQEKLNIGKLDKLKSLIIRWNQIPELDDDVFSKGLSNLETLNIFKNNIKKLGNNVFSQLNNLKILVLQDNQLGSIKRSMLPSTADRLTSLYLSNNSLTDLPEDIFAGMPSLKKFSLEYNPITTLDERTWSSIWQQLTHIYFLLSCINMWSLYVIILILGLSCRVYTEDSCPDEQDLFPCGCNIIHSRRPPDFEDVVRELTVTCKFNKRTGDFETLRKGLSSLSGRKDVHLKLEGYDISMPSKLFSGIDIKQLIFESCHMYSSTNDDQPWFLGLENNLEDLIIENSLTVEEKLNIGQLNKLKSLIIRRNQIPELEDDVFGGGLPNLETLAIFQNNIKKIGNNVFSQLNNLKTLELEDDQFGPIKRSMLPTTADRLTSLRLDNNGLTELPEDIFTRMPSLNWISLRFNPITTLDERVWTPIWQQLRTIQLYDNRIICDERLNWIRKTKKWPVHVFGQCYGPKELKGKHLTDFFES